MTRKVEMAGDRCTVCGRLVNHHRDYLDFGVGTGPLCESGYDCTCGYAYQYGYGNTEVTFAGRWREGWCYRGADYDSERKAYEAIQTRLNRHERIWRWTWWLLKPLFISVNFLEQRWFRWKRRKERNAQNKPSCHD